ncbi:MAG: hypothetical protein NTZ49_00370 [Candidatus Parcubacteria bacterium]|nr:hypothetical protein [Candidatus Parcubacteria bacterium]
MCALLRYDNCSIVTRFYLQTLPKNQVCVRLVNDYNTADRFSDILIGKTINSLLAVKILIGNWATKANMSGIGWEIYQDSALQGCLDRGRYDQYDLWNSHDPKERESLVSQNIYPHGDWDFDSFLLLGFCNEMHPLKSHHDLTVEYKCPICQRKCFEPDRIQRIYLKKVMRYSLLKSVQAVRKGFSLSDLIDLSTFLIYQAMSYYVLDQDYFDKMLKMVDGSSMDCMPKLYQQSIFYALSRCKGSEQIFDHLQQETEKMLAVIGTREDTSFNWIDVQVQAEMFDSYFAGLSLTMSKTALEFQTIMRKAMESTLIPFIMQLIDILYRYQAYLDANFHPTAEEEAI